MGPLRGGDSQVLENVGGSAGELPRWKGDQGDKNSAVRVRKMGIVLPQGCGELLGFPSIRKLCEHVVI